MNVCEQGPEELGWQSWLAGIVRAVMLAVWHPERRQSTNMPVPTSQQSILVSKDKFGAPDSLLFCLHDYLHLCLCLFGSGWASGHARTQVARTVWVRQGIWLMFLDACVSRSLQLCALRKMCWLQMHHHLLRGSHVKIVLTAHAWLRCWNAVHT